MNRFRPLDRRFGSSGALDHVFPPNTQSRHAVIHMKISMTEEDLASTLYETFDIAATGGVITNTLSVWIEGLCLFTNMPGAPTLVTGAGNLVSARNFGKGIELLGATKGGIIELVVLSEQQFARCPDCNHQGLANAVMLQRVRERDIDVGRLCVGCLQQSGVPSGTDEVILRGEIQVQAIRG
ncbi:MAG: hypothetical protein ASARMPREDX12_001615 [Alectoria sarmentosa]|nr:MAG: hypothetical protein ASARMPREDX12_001615 [Alectoria sarmentosa]